MIGKVPFVCSGKLAYSKTSKLLKEKEEGQASAERKGHSHSKREEVVSKED